MVRQLYRDSDEDNSRFTKEGLSKLYDNHSIDDFLVTSKELASRFDIKPDITPHTFYVDVHQNECNTIAIVSTGILNLNTKVIYRHPNCTVKPVVPPLPKRENKVTPLQKPENPCDGVPLYIVCPLINYSYRQGTYGQTIPTYDNQTGEYFTNGGEYWSLFERYLTILKVRYPVYFEGYGWGATITFHEKYSSIRGDRSGGGSDSDYVYEGTDSVNVYPGCTEREARVWYAYDDGYRIAVLGDQNAPELIVGIGVFPIPDSHLNSVDDAYAYRNRSSFFSVTAQQPAYTDGSDNLPPINVSSPGGSFTLTKSGKACIDTFYGRVCWYDVPIMSVINIEYSALVLCGDYDRDSPPPPKDMSCCPNVQENDQLLRLLLTNVKKLSAIVGVDEYPATLPKSLITRNGKNQGVTKVENLTRLLEWYIGRFDELMGQFEIDIQITDTDLTKEGNQSKTVRLPNLAESIAEMFGLMMQSSINTDLLVNICTRTLTETGQDKQQNFKAHQALMAIVDYLGFNYQEKSQTMPLSFKPGEKSFDKLLKETDTQVKVIDFHEKETLNHYLHELLQAAAITRAANWRKIDAGGDIALQLLDRVYQHQNVRNQASKIDIKDLEQLIKDLTVPPTKEKKHL
jgi:hypothetical protein